MKFKCNGCRRATEFIEVEWKNKPLGFAIYQCKSCGATGVKNKAEEIKSSDASVSRCKNCGAWQFDNVPCYTCLLIGENDNV